MSFLACYAGIIPVPKPWSGILDDFPMILWCCRWKVDVLPSHATGRQIQGPLTLTKAMHGLELKAGQFIPYFVGALRSSLVLDSRRQ